MISLLLEGLEAALLPCSLIVLIPGAAVALASRQESTSALAGFAGGTLAFAWLGFSGRGGDLSNGVVALLFAGAGVMVAIPFVRRLNLVSATGGTLAGIASGVLWVPCVGDDFGQLLTELPSRGASGLILLAVYLLGVLAPLLVLGAVLHLVPNGALVLVRPFMLITGGGTLAFLALATAAGFTDELIGRLVEWSVA